MNGDSLLSYLCRSGPNMNIQEYQVLSSMLSAVGTGCYQASLQMISGAEEVWSSYQKVLQSGYQPVKVLIVGEFNTGKSTFINAFLGRELLCSEVIPSTAVITYICYGAQEGLSVVFKDGRNMMFDIKELAELTSENGMKYRNIRKDISAIYVYLPLPILMHITLIDSPGVNVRIQRHEDVTYSMLEEADFIIWLMSAVQAGKKTEIRAIAQLPEHLKPFIVINRIDLIDEDDKKIDDTLDKIWQRIKKHCRGYIGISAYQALKGIQEQDRSLYAESRMGNLVQYIEENLIEQWGKIKISSIQGHLKRRKEQYYILDVKEQKKEVQSLQSWIKNNSARKKWETLADLISDREKFVEKIDISKEIFELETLYKEHRLLNEIDKLENPIIYINMLIQENQILNAISAKQIEELKMIYQGLHQYYYYCMQYTSIVMQNSSVEVFRYMQGMVGNYVQYFAMVKEKILQYSNIYEKKEEEYMKDKIDKVKEWREKNKAFEQLSRKINETIVIDEVSKFMKIL